jgi:NAD(P)-dependent dehydrogenase (short-subunit alcohol dehydrogenase family)
MALATAKLFVEEGAPVFITGRRQQQLDEAVKAYWKQRKMDGSWLFAERLLYVDWLEECELS